jgi:D-alanine-D-alanine ligase
MKPTVAVLFGGKSTEHEVSVITGLQAFSAIDRSKYNAVPVYITKGHNYFFTGDAFGKIENYADIPALFNAKGRKRVFIIEGSLCELKGNKIDFKKAVTIDAVLLCVHGTNVEDGSLQGFLEMQGIPYTGCDVLSSAVGMDKAVQKAVLRQFAEVPVLDCVAFTAKKYVANADKVLSEIAEKINLPVIVKPINLGSSIGIRIAKTREELPAAIEHALLFADKIIVERAVSNLKEINCAVLGDKDDARASECEEPVNSGGILDFNDKYAGGKKSGNGAEKSSGMVSLKRRIPADITPSQREQIREMAVRAFKTLGCAGVARIDFLLDTETNDIFFNEINTIPGSLSFYLWDSLGKGKDGGLSYSELIDELIRLALKRERDKSALTFSFESNILSSFKGGTGSKI